MAAGGLLVKAETPLAESEGSQPRSKAQERINTFVVEEFLEGYEVDIDLVMYKGQCLYRLLTDNGAAYFNGWGERTGAMWAEFRQRLGEALGDDEEALRSASAAAVATFGALLACFEQVLLDHGPAAA